MALNKVKETLFNFPDATEVVLENFNITSLDELMPDLCKLKSLKVLRLGNNLLTKIPSDMSGLSRLEYLDLSRNPFPDVPSIMSGLFSLPSLKHLYINLSEADEDDIIISLTNLESFNGTPLTDIPDLDYPSLHSSPVHQSISRTTTTTTHHTKAATAVADNGISSVNNSTLSGIQSPSAQLNRSNVSSSVENVDLTQMRALFFLIGKFTNTKSESELSRIWNDISAIARGESSDSLESQRILLQKITTDFLEKLRIAQPQLYPLISAAFSQFDSLLIQHQRHSTRITNEYQTKIRILQRDLDHSDQEIGQLLEAAEILEKDTQENELAKKRLADQFESEKEKLVEEVGFLRAELEKYKNRLRQFQLNRQKISTQVNTSPRQLLNASKSATGEYGIGNKLAKNQVKTNKVLSLKQLREAIDEIYISKAKFDQKCVDNQLPRETMEQHLYTYLNQKYGLKNLILEWASAIIQAIKKYSTEDNAVAVFGKILRNEIDEEFRFVQRQLCDTVAELLRVYVKGKYPRKVDSEIMTMLQKKMGNSGVLSEEEWVDIIKYMYNKEDSVNVIVKVQEAINKLNLRRQKNKKEQLRDNKILYNEFLKVLLDFQLKGHERFLSKFVKLFRQFDTDRNGILNELEFRKLLLAINPERTEGDVDYWLNHIDPWNNQQITFSECVTFLSADLVKMMQDTKRQEELDELREEEEEEDSDEEEATDDEEEDDDEDDEEH